MSNMIDKQQEKAATFSNQRTSSAVAQSTVGSLVVVKDVGLLGGSKMIQKLTFVRVDLQILRCKAITS